MIGAEGPERVPSFEGTAYDGSDGGGACSHALCGLVPPEDVTFGEHRTARLGPGLGIGLELELDPDVALARAAL